MSPTTDLAGNRTNIFASRFDSASNRWLPSGADRAGGAQVPSLNIHTNRTAEEPSVAGGAAVAGNNPLPWVVWREHDGATTDGAARFQIFVSRGISGAATCAGVTPGSGTPVNGFCFQQTGIKRLSATSLTSAAGDPTLSIDPTRNSEAPDIAFTGPSDTVPWTVWYEENASGIGLHHNDMVFAAKGVADTTAGAGGFHWQAVGNGTAGKTQILDRSGAHGFGACAASAAAEGGCSLNKVVGADAENPRVATGTLTPGGTTVPWVTWQEEHRRRQARDLRVAVGERRSLRAVQQRPALSNTPHDATNPDITFSGNEPYVTWQENVSGHERVFSGHFEGGAAAPVFRLDTPTGIAISAFGAVPDLIPPISSGCTADPFTVDGSSCPSAAAGTPFFLFTDGAPGSQRLFARAYKPGVVRPTRPAR